MCIGLVAVIGDKRSVYKELAAKPESRKQIRNSGRRCDDMLQYILFNCDGRM